MSQKTVCRKKMVVVGDGAVGKTSLLISFAKDEFPELYVPTVFETYLATVEVGNCLIQLSLWDTAGQEDYDRLRPLSYPDTDVALGVFAVDSTDSFNNIEEKWAIELEHFCKDAKKVLAAQKVDLREDPEIINMLSLVNQKPLQSSHTKEMCLKVNFDTHHECSAKTKIGIKELFESIAKLSLLHTPKKTKFLKCTIL
ncbi:GTP-binding protein RHO1 [Intoshia linei]|uniref:GTP-binding protein RHO1 n=1 Tax=Intoshia linei TaxID=1819745 RepID=A0A177AYV4_9BILA|nr:GTP-binding protein RHO1 [Intoshia linei]